MERKISLKVFLVNEISDLQVADVSVCMKESINYYHTHLCTFDIENSVLIRNQEPSVYRLKAYLRLNALGVSKEPVFLLFTMFHAL